MPPTGIYFPLDLRREKLLRNFVKISHAVTFARLIGVSSGTACWRAVTIILTSTEVEAQSNIETVVEEQSLLKLKLKFKCLVNNFIKFFQ